MSPPPTSGPFKRQWEQQEVKQILGSSVHSQNSLGWLCAVEEDKANPLWSPFVASFVQSPLGQLCAVETKASSMWSLLVTSFVQSPPGQLCEVKT